MSARPRRMSARGGKAVYGASLGILMIVLECTNMPPCAAALRDAVQVPVYDIYSMATWFHAGLRPRAWTPRLH